MFVRIFLEVHILVNSIRQAHETEVNDFKHILQLFGSTNENEQLSEILRLRKRVEELQTNKVERIMFLFLVCVCVFVHS
jgi:hypothetical protein